MNTVRMILCGNVEDSRMNPSEKVGVVSVVFVSTEEEKINGYISKMVNSRNRINEKIIFLHVSNTEEICDLMHSFLD